MVAEVVKLTEKSEKLKSLEIAIGHIEKAFGKGSVLVANTADTLTALDGGGSADGILFYTASADTIAWATSLDGGTF